MRTLVLSIVLSALAAPVQAQSSMQLFGYAGVLGEWEVAATVTENASSRSKEFSGPLSLKHVGLCTQDGPEEPVGKIALQLTASSSRLDATLSVEGVSCSYSGRLSDSYAGMMICPGRPTVPLTLWVK